MSILATDNFTRANNTDLGTAWDENSGGANANGFDILSNTAVASLLPSDSAESNNTVTWPTEQYAKAVFSATAADGVGTGSGVICCEPSRTAKTYYRAVGNASGYEFGRFNAGVLTSLSSGTGTTFTAGDSLQLDIKINGANRDWTLRKNGTSFATGTDTSPLTSGRVGVGYSSTSASLAVSALSSFEGGDFAATMFPPFPPPPNLVRF